jgi:transcriptional regulator with XRE-family HTH domain
MLTDVDVLGTKVNRAFGERLRTIRRNRNYSQTEFAKRIGKSRATVANLESGKQNVQLQQIFEFAVALDAPVEAFIPSRADIDARDQFSRVRSDLLEPADVLFLHTAKSKLEAALGGINEKQI